MSDRFGLTIRSAHPGLLLLSNGGQLLMKTEYGDNDGKLDVFIVDSGERYVGSFDRECLEVTEAVIGVIRSTYKLSEAVTL